MSMMDSGSGYNSETGNNSTNNTATVLPPPAMSYAVPSSTSFPFSSTGIASNSFGDPFGSQSSSSISSNPSLPFTASSSSSGLTSNPFSSISFSYNMSSNASNSGFMSSTSNPGGGVIPNPFSSGASKESGGNSVGFTSNSPNPFSSVGTGQSSVSGYSGASAVQPSVSINPFSHSGASSTPTAPSGGTFSGGFGAGGGASFGGNTNTFPSGGIGGGGDGNFSLGTGSTANRRKVRANRRGVN